MQRPAEVINLTCFGNGHGTEQRPLESHDLLQLQEWPMPTGELQQTPQSFLEQKDHQGVQCLSGLPNFDVVDDARSGRPVDATTEENVAALQRMVDEDARVTVAQLEETIGISLGSIGTILHKKLALSKVSARWVPHHLTKEQKAAQVDWCCRMLERELKFGVGSGQW